MAPAVEVRRSGDLLSAAGRLLTGRGSALALAILAISAGVLTYAWFGGILPRAFNTRAWLTVLLVADLLLVAALLVVLTVRIVQLVLERRRGAAGSRLHVRLVLVCGLFATVPTLMVAIIFSLLALNLSDYVVKPSQAAFESARAIGEPVRRAREREILNDIGQIAVALQGLGIEAVRDSEATSRLLGQLMEGRPVLEVVVVDADRGVVARATALGSTPLEQPVPAAQFLWQAVNQALPVEIPGGTGGAYFLLQLFVAEPLFLVTGHAIDLRLADYIRSIDLAGRFYVEIEQGLRRNQLVVFGLLGMIALLMLLAAVWLAILFASRMTEPIGELMAAAEKMRGGDFAVRVEEGPPNDELGRLSRSFNRMAGQIEQQRRDLVDANAELDTRRRLTDAVLAGVSAGVLSVDAEGRVARANESALALLSLPEDGVIGRRLVELLPQLASLLAQALERPDRAAQAQVEFAQRGAARTLMVRIARPADGTVVVTFDDVTDLMSAQRMAAWGDVARRIAHEIKNPLTPIQLSAERLRRRYLKQIVDDPETFQICTDTIIRQVGDIGRMVDEFSSFARMPRPTLAPEDARELCQQALFLQRNGNPGIAYRGVLPDGPVTLRCDRRQIGQVLTNILKNAAEAIEGRDAAGAPPGEISLTLQSGADGVAIVVEDNGKGLPVEGRERLTEPYMTTRTKGTGLGLAIVKKIMEDHGGRLDLGDREGGGARIGLLFPPEAATQAEQRHLASARGAGND